MTLGRGEMVHAAQMIATAKHAGAWYDVKVPYIVHPAEVAELAKALGYGPEIQAAAWLHDTVEDTDTTYEELRDEGFPEFVVEAVEAVTYTVDDERCGITKAAKARKHIGGHAVKFCDSSRNLANALRSCGTTSQEVLTMRIDKYLQILTDLHSDRPLPADIERSLGFNREWS